MKKMILKVIEKIIYVIGYIIAKLILWIGGRERAMNYMNWLDRMDAKFSKKA